MRLLIKRSGNLRVLTKICILSVLGVCFEFERDVMFESMSRESISLERARVVVLIKSMWWEEERRWLTRGRRGFKYPRAAGPH